MDIYEAVEKSVSPGTVEKVFIDLEQFLSILTFPFECRNLIGTFRYACTYLSRNAMMSPISFLFCVDLFLLFCQNTIT